MQTGKSNQTGPKHHAQPCKKAKAKWIQVVAFLYKKSEEPEEVLAIILMDFLRF